MRLKELKAYHGSANNHQAFNVLHTGHNSTSFSDYNSKRYGVFFTKNPKFAALYGDVKQYDLNIKKTLKLDSSRANDIIFEFSEQANEYSNGLRHDALNVLRGHWPKWHLFEDELGKYFVAYLKSLGFDSASFSEDHEDPNKDGKFIVSDTIVVFNPSKIVKDGQLELNLYDHQLTKAFNV